MSVRPWPPPHLQRWASPIELKLCARCEVVVVGGSNSAGQATVFLANHGARVYLLVRGRNLGDSMSQYLIDRIRFLPNVDVRTQTELTKLTGVPSEGAQAVCWRESASGKEECHPIRHVFLLIGAQPNTHWLRSCSVRVDDKGVVQTGDRASACIRERVLYRRILLAVDLTSDSLEIGRRARTLAENLGAQMETIHVVEPIPTIAPIPPDPLGVIPITTSVDQAALAQNQIATLARELGVPDSRWSVITGNTKSEIVSAASQSGADLIVIGSHERHGLAFLVKPTEDVVAIRRLATCWLYD